MKVIASHNVFLNTAETQSGTSRRAKFLFPQGVAQAGPGQALRISLTSFSMKDNAFYGVDSNSNTFYVVTKNIATGAIDSAPVVIPPGAYNSYVGSGVAPEALGLCTAIQTAINTAAAAVTGLTSVAVTYNETTQKATYTWTLTAGYEIKMVCFTTFAGDAYPTIFDTILGAAPTPEQRFSSAFEIIGGANQVTDPAITGTPAQQFDQLTNMVNGVTGATVTLMPMRFSYLENFYIRTDIPNANWQSADFSTGASRLPRFQPSNILAKIHIPNPYNDDYRQVDLNNAHEHYHYALRGRQCIFWRDTGSKIWSQTLPVQSINEMTISITDEYGRIVPWPSAEAEANNLGGAEIALCVDVLQE